MSPFPWASTPAAVMEGVRGPDVERPRRGTVQTRLLLYNKGDTRSRHEFNSAPQSNASSYFRTDHVVCIPGRGHPGESRRLVAFPRRPDGWTIPRRRPLAITRGKSFRCCFYAHENGVLQTCVRETWSGRLSMRTNCDRDSAA